MAKGDGSRRGLSSGTRMPLAITLCVLAVIAVIYLGYYRSQVEYYTGRNLRLLSMLTAQTEARVELLAGLVAPGEAHNVKRGIVDTANGRGLRLELGEEKKTHSLDEVLRPLFARRVGAAFDVLLVADESGNVLYSIRPPGQSSTLLYRDPDDEGERDESAAAPAEETRASSIAITKLSALQRSAGWRKKEKLDLTSLTTTTKHLDVTLDDDAYVLFTQPYAVSTAESSLDGKPKQWIIGGLVSESRFRYDVMLVSGTVTLLAIAVALLAICCWPFLRIALMDPREALTITDVVLIVICTIVGAAVLTLALLDVFAYRRLTQSADEQLKRFADGINEDFGRDVARGMVVLQRLAELTKDMPEGQHAFSEEVGKAAATYPYIDTAFWVDPNGRQVVKLSRDGKSQQVPVGDRRYFRDALRQRTWSVGEQPYVLEWVHSKAAGEVRAVLSMATADPEKRPVFAMATELINVSHAIAPPGVAMAVIDENGQVVYHSDSQRIGFENFFEETDQNRELRSAVVARRDGFVSASYWGQNYSMFVRPLEGSPWTLVAFRAKRLTRVVNIEGVLLTLMFLMLCAMPVFLIYIAVIVFTPQYRAPRLWPQPGRWSEYLRLCIILAALLVLSFFNKYALTPWSSFFGAMFLPGIAIVSTYLVLHRTGAPRRFAIASALWLALNALLIAFMVRGDLETRFFASWPWIGKTLLLAIAIGVAVLTWRMLWWRSDAMPRRARVGYATLYRIAGVLLLGVCVAMPVMAFFRISRHVESELLVKYGQLRAAADLEHRIVHLRSLSLSGAVAEDVRVPRFRQVFGSRWRLYSDNDTPPCKVSPDSWTIHEDAAIWMPPLYEDSIAIRPLFVAQSADDLWHWCLREPYIELVRRIRFDPDVAKWVWGTIPREQKIVIVSPLDRAALEHELDDRPSDNPEGGIFGGNPQYPLAGMSVVLLLAIVFWYAVDFIAKRVLLIDVGEPAWLARLPLSPTLGDHIFLVRRDRSIDALTGPDPMGKGLPFFDVSFAKLGTEEAEWSAMLERLDSSEAGRNVRVVDFEHAINDAAVNEKKLRWLERLLALPDRTVIVVSTVSAKYIFTTAAPDATDYFDRWRALLERFVWVTAEELELRTAPAREEPLTWLERETEYNAFLRRLRGELDPSIDRQILIDEIGERAETYYAGLWASCHDEEKLLLYNLAHNGLANGSNRRMLRRLIARGFVRRDPNLQLFSETFRLYVLSAARKEDLVDRTRELRGPSTWDSLRVPFFVVIVAFLILLFTTQKDLMTTTTALATALTTGIPMLMKLLGVFTERRLEGAERS